MGSSTCADGSPLSWWLDREGERRSYWGGFLPGVQQCSCSLEENCIDLNYFCNCDADTDAWANDTGLLSYKEHLPVSQIVIGDTNRTGSRAVVHAGSLRCYGDKSIWNAASFYQESSYLYFPTLQAELASDISFYFKTSTPSGVFLENQGLKDFIRVELSSPSVVTFSFDVGDGPALLSVKSPIPLNDRQWHYVRAERNVKESSLQVDQLPLRFLAAPGRRAAPLTAQQSTLCGGNSVPAEGLPGLHSLPDSQRRELRPGGAGQDDAWSERRLPWLLQRLQQPLPQPREVHREEQRLHLRLLAVRLRRHHLQPRGLCVL
ncbi:Contactin-associated protein-like 5 [Oryzias melastigma]|uniref:Contactin-associated protein-like 5 n=1 Tax=Oryzias melastigma TaxID=30732 RepID=A0A834FFA1_ORYME|nr:Contactin-associated protein-like 5 [Oryzias melastigma]